MKLLVCALGFVALVSPQTPPAPAAPGELISVGEHRLFLSCQGPRGSGSTVILEAGGGGSSAEWDQVKQVLGPAVRTCAYDRAGLGRSDAGPQPRTMHQEVFELHALLAAAGEKPPFVMAGQSIGGLLVRLYVDAYPADVAGVVLVDPTHESSMLGSLRYGGWVRLREKATGRGVPPPRLTPAGGAPVDPDADYLAEEFQMIFKARQAVPQSLGARPLVVLAAGKRPAPPGTTPDQWKVLNAEKEEQLQDQAGLSSNARFIRDEASGHSIHRDNPSLVARAIADVRDAVASGGRLRPPAE